ncbi:mercury methylation ferredoxin HgcB [Alkaliphilus peptidifermentans]|uniref:4Fe-4S dicluster domain-containing protein n=1 Tax=Alkaliphilus peptidifermentans DSM 18978 TaxID=1120976 RepID=A0A1G5LB74_9FIRM|nr:mercury methylation ferredoxin HgcB [Alkaliphilus peptidifermentans]SCZ10122.1 4Fe-4S dicluster domain-containing protein [Alkaliphilus peptidifermentans DSM 18978]
MAIAYIKNVAQIKLDREKCIGCRMCLNVCPHTVFEMQEGKAKFKNKDACIECGACDRNCPVEAIEVKSGVG